MDSKGFSPEAKSFLQHLLESGEPWLIESIKKIYDKSSDEKDFLEEVGLYLTRLELKTRKLKQECEHLIGI